MSDGHSSAMATAFPGNGTRVAGASSGQPPSRRGKLPIRFVTRMSVDLSRAVATAAREDGLTAGAWVRRLLLERVRMHSPADERSGRPVRCPGQDTIAISSAIRHLADVSGAVSVGDKAAAQTGLQHARGLLIPLVVRRPE